MSLRRARISGGCAWRVDCSARTVVKYLPALAILAACTSPPGAEPPDIDRVTVIAAPGSTVLYYGDDGALLDRVVTGDDGRARSIVAPISSVLVTPAAAGGEFYSWVGVWQGDHLYTANPMTLAAADAGHHMAITIPRFANDATDYAISAVGMTGTATVAPGTEPVTLDATIAADAPTTSDVIAQVATGAASHFLVAHAVSLATGTADLRTGHWEPGAPYSATVGLPAGAAWVSARDQRLSGGRLLWQDEIRADAPAGNVALSFVSPQAGDAGALAVDYQLADGTTYALSYNEPPDGLDTAALMPLATDIVRAADGSVTWSSSQTADDEIGVELVQLGASTQWHIMMPPGQRAFAPPVIPADLPQLPALANARVTFVVGNEPGAYGALRNDVNVFDLPNWGRVMPINRGTYRFGGI